jgi:hypothetical protein
VVVNGRIAALVATRFDAHSESSALDAKEGPRSTRRGTTSPIAAPNPTSAENGTKNFSDAESHNA